MSYEVAIRAAGLGKSYRFYRRPEDRLKEALLGRPFGEDFWAVRDVDFEVRRGETLGIIGRNGSGKSTLLQLVCGTLRPSAGNLTVSGRVAALLELGAGFNGDFTGRENVHLSASVLGLSDREIAERLPSIEAFAGIGAFIDRPVRQYSSGMYARLAFAVCAHVDADILVIDEILAVGDAAFQQQCMRFLHAFRARGTLLFVSHDEAAVLGLCERALWLDRGEMRELGAAREVCRRYLAGVGQANDGVDQLPPVRGNSRWAGTNPIEIFDFDPDAPWHGHGGGRIETASFYRPHEERLRLAEGGEEVELRVVCRAERPLMRPIVGFLLRNPLGQNLFGDNTYATYRLDPVAIDPGRQFTATFRFQLPYLPSGDYGLTLAITEGTQQDHIHLHWIERAMTLRVTASPIAHGKLGIAMHKISIALAREEAGDG